MALREVTNIQHSTTARKKDFHVRILNEYAKSIFPAPKKLRFAKRTCNDELKHKIGEFMCVNDTLTIAAWGKNRGKDGNIAFVYNEFNNIFVDLQRLQRAMILFYGLPHQCK